MEEFPSTQAKDKWGTIADAALQGPVTITKHGRPSLVVTSVKDYEYLQQLKLKQLKAQVQEGVDALERGDFIELHNEEELRDHMHNIMKRGRERLNKQDK